MPSDKITGATGLAGSQPARRLVKTGCQVGVFLLADSTFSHEAGFTYMQTGKVHESIQVDTRPRWLKTYQVGRTALSILVVMK
jgi:hypothetical protein